MGYRAADLHGMPRKRREAIRDLLEGELHYAELRREEKDYFAALKMIESMMLDGKTDRSIRFALKDRYAMKRRAANTAMQDTRQLFGDTRRVDRNWQRYRAEQMALKIYEIAELEGNTAQMLKATKLYIEANGLNSDDPDLPQFDSLQAAVNVLSLPPEMEAQAKLLLSQGVIDMTRLPDLPETEDTTYVELDPSAGGAAQG